MYGRLSVGIMSAFHHALQLEQNPEQLNSSCPSAAWASAASGAPLPVNLLSISPWAYRMSHESSRYPRSIPEAYCLCRGCLIGPYGQESADFRSVPVLAPAVVLRRRGPCVAGRFTYSEHYISVAVGCTCVPLMEQDNTV
ncbi:interleukin-17D [Eucyclogobius newberryi]|uniref:interleukin-17D n=1 Tax=Eucyclogobius newberryi TaxID=166745 RepID=UPI003B58DEEB